MRTAETAFDMLRISQIAARNPVTHFMSLPLGFEQTDRIALRDARSRDSSYSGSWLCLGALCSACPAELPEVRRAPTKHGGFGHVGGSGNGGWGHGGWG